jgi:hypothetical protein
VSARTVRRWIIVLVLLQVAVIVLMPLRAGPRMPSGTMVVLRADAGDSPGADFQDMPSQEIWLDYGFDELEVPDEYDRGGEVYVELVGDPDGDEPLQLGRVFADEDELDDDMTWLTLWVDGSGDVDEGPIGVWFDDDEQRIEELRTHAEDGGRFDVRIVIDNDGDATIEDVTAAGG